MLQMVLLTGGKCVCSENSTELTPTLKAVTGTGQLLTGIEDKQLNAKFVSRLRMWC